MSRRTAESNKAIRLAWEREQALVREGKGTRDWTPEQQRDILDPNKGKAYDEKGRAFEGQHMRSVAEYPEFQGDPNNIQFLTKEEHLEAHRGNWQYPTNWFYNPDTKEFVDFGEGEIIPCEIIRLSNPIVIPATNADGVEKKDPTPTQEKPSEKNDKSPPHGERDKTSASSTTHTKKSGPKTTSSKKKTSSGFIEKVWRWAKARGEYFLKNPEKVIGGLVTIGGIGAAIKNVLSELNNGSGGGGAYSNSYESPDLSSGDDNPDIFEDVDDSDTEDTSSKRDYPDERFSPREHDVSGYERQQNGKTVHVKPYKRGGRKED